MGLRVMEHILILTDDPDGTRDWWCQVLGMRAGDHPDFGFPVHWLYIGDQDVVHIGQAKFSAHQDTYLKTPKDTDLDVPDGRRGSGRIDHVCFNCDDMPGFLARLAANNVAFSERKAHNSDLYQLFFRDPINGIKVELNFSAAEAVRTGRVPAWTDKGATV